jgi:hypothetical protein
MSHSFLSTKVAHLGQPVWSIEKLMSTIYQQRHTQEHDSKRAIGFAASSVLPGEDQEEFDLLLDELCVQYEAEGPAEEDAVQTMANAIWRKRHLEIFQRAIEARMRWGPHFNYPGDPAGFGRITQESRHLLEEYTTLFVTKMVEKELDETGATKAVGQTQTNDNTTCSALPEGIFKRMVENATAGIKVNNEEKTHRSAMHAEDMKYIVREVAKKEFATENANSELCSIGEQNEKMLDAFIKLMAAFETALDRAVVQDILEKMLCKSTEQSLAKFGDLLTPECYMAELCLIELLDLSIERSYDRLIKLQNSRAKKSRGNPLQPDWMARRR